MTEMERLEKYREGYNAALAAQGRNGNELGRHTTARLFGAWFMRSDWDDWIPAWAMWCNIPFKERMNPQV